MHFESKAYDYLLVRALYEAVNVSQEFVVFIYGFLELTQKNNQMTLSNWTISLFLH